MNIFSSLNEKQIHTVKETEGYVRVIAGAGSGKTKLLVSRYAYLVKEYGISPSNILCVTFTNKAAAEMKSRITNLIGPEYSTSLICTYHGFCARLIRENPEKLFLTKGFQIIDTYQQKSMLEEIFQKYELKLDYANFQDILKRIAAKKYIDISYVERMAQTQPNQILLEIKDQKDKIIEDYLQRQKAIYALDFSDLLNYALYLLKNDEEVRTKWQDRLNYIQVDEFQDSARTEMELINILSAKYKNLMIVGDPDQNIYEWRGSDVRLLIDFDKNHPDTKTVILNQNYRSTPQILKCANQLIEKNELRLKKDLFTNSPDGIKVTHIHSKSDDDEVTRIVKEIKTIRKVQKKSYSDFAILYRSSFLSRQVEKKLVEENIPYEIWGGVKFYQRMEILDIVAYLRLIAFQDDLSFKRIINTPRRKFGRTRLQALQNIRDNNEINLFDLNNISSKTLYEVLKTHLSDPAFAGSGGPEFINLIEKFISLKNSLRISELVNSICIESGYEEYIRELGDEERLDNLAEFKRIANEYEASNGEDVSLEQFLQQIALMSAEDNDKPCEAVKLMTIHASKGLEFPVVFIVGFTEGIFPSSKTIEERKKLGLEEERRLCYVAITRAREILYLMDSEGLSQNGIKKLPSRFIFEIGEHNYQRIGLIDEELRKESSNYIRKLNLNLIQNLPAPEPDKNQIVNHHIFGQGKVVSYNEKTKDYTIQFEKMALPRIINAEYFSKEHSNSSDSINLPQINENLNINNNNDISLISGEVFISEEDAFNTWENEFSIISEEDFSESLVSNEINIEKEIIVEEKVNVEIKDEITENQSDNVFSEKSEIELSEISEELREKLNNAKNHWKESDFPKTDWFCTGVTDLGGPAGICEMCGFQIIRYVHHMYHTESGKQINCGCVCAGKLEGDISKAQKREASFKSKQQRKHTFLSKKWKISEKGHEYIRIKNNLIVLVNIKDENKWRFSINGVFNQTSFNNKASALDCAFETLEKLLY